MSILSLCRHSCTIVKSGESTDGYGHTSRDWGSGATRTSGVRCFYQPKAEIENITESQISYQTIYIPFLLAPASLKVMGSEASHRVENVLREDGSLMDAGPFDIYACANAAGKDHHLRLLVFAVS